jgi:hypothetical protein
MTRCLARPKKMTAFFAAIAAMTCGRGDEETSPAAADGGSVSDAPAETHEAGPKQRPLYVGMMVHLEHTEQWPTKVTPATRETFKATTTALRDVATVFERYKAKLTLESAGATESCLAFGDNVLKEMEQRGHAIGLHADVGSEANATKDSMVAQLNAMRVTLDKLGVTYRHVSGICSRADWVTAAIESGFSFTTGQVGYCALSLQPPSQIPAELQSCKVPLDCHGAYPSELSQRIRPWRMASGDNWLTDNPSGKLVLIPSSEGLPCFEENATGAGGKGCAIGDGDITAYIAEIDAALKLHKPDGFSTHYVGVFLGSSFPDVAFWEKFFAALEPYVAAGKVQWMTFPQMFDDYMQWLSTK